MNHYCYDDHSEYEIIVNNHTSDESFYLSVVAAANASSPVGTFTTPKDASNPTMESSVRDIVISQHSRTHGAT